MCGAYLRRGEVCLFAWTSPDPFVVREAFALSAYAGKRFSTDWRREWGRGGCLRIDFRKTVSVTVSLLPTKFVLTGQARVTIGFWYSCKYERYDSRRATCV